MKKKKPRRRNLLITITRYPSIIRRGQYDWHLEISDVAVAGQVIAKGRRLYEWSSSRVIHEGNVISHILNL